jgi:hypothetical protein
MGLKDRCSAAAMTPRVRLADRLEPSCCRFLSQTLRDPQVPGSGHGPKSARSLASGWGQNNTGLPSRVRRHRKQALSILPGSWAKKYAEAQRLFAEQLPVVPLFPRLALAATRPDVQLRDGPDQQQRVWNVENFDYGTRSVNPFFHY